VEAFDAPQELARRAHELGMVPAPHTAFLTLPDGSIEGEPAVAVAPPKPKPKPKRRPARPPPARRATHHTGRQEDRDEARQDGAGHDQDVGRRRDLA